MNCFQYADNEQTEIIDGKEFSEDIVSNMESAFSFIVSKINRSIKIDNKLKHNEKNEIPIPAIRECVVNALVHRDYFVNSSVQINISPEIIEFVNPGKLLFSESEFGKISVRRNPIIVDLMHRIGFVEKAGSGIKRIKKLASDNSIKVEFTHTDFFRVIFYRPKIRSEANPKQIRSKSEVNMNRKTSKADKKTRKLWIIDYLKKNKVIKAGIVEEKFNIHRDTAVSDLKALGDIIVKKGAGNNIWYELNSQERL